MMDLYIWQITTKREYWQQYDHWPFIKNWIALEEVNKLRSFFAQFDEDKVHPRYNCLVRTGRTSCTSPNIQQLPREGGVREKMSRLIDVYVDFLSKNLNFSRIVQRESAGGRRGFGPSRPR